MVVHSHRRLNEAMFISVIIKKLLLDPICVQTVTKMKGQLYHVNK